MRNFAAVAGLTALSALTANSIVLPQSVGDQRFAADEAAAASSQNVKRSTNDGVFAKRNQGESIRLELNHSKRQPVDSMDKVKEFAANQKAYVQQKYGKKKASDAEKRQVAGLVDYGQDSFYFAQVAVGTPAQNFNIILDTGSSDFWVTDADCRSSQCADVALYNTGASSSSVQSQTPFQIQYGSGAVRGTLYADTVALAGYTVFNTTVAGVTQLATGTLRSPTSGIMGMGFEQLATSGATPFWEVLAKSGTLQTQAFTFQLQRNKMASQDALSSGGVFTLGEIDGNQYQGDITYTNLPNSQRGRAGYWAIPLDNVQLNGNTISTSGQLAAIDTGTTLIGAPEDIADQFYSQIPNAQPVNVGGEQGYYAYPCDTNLNVAFTFGGKTWSINSADFSGGTVAQDRSGQNYCLGAIFGANLGSGAPEWIVGDSFLKNVFSVYEYEPTPRVGFAELKNGQAQNAPVSIGLVPSGTAANRQQVSPASSATASTGGGVGPPSLSVDSAAATQTNIVGGSGLPNPVAANAVATASNLTPSSSSPAAAAAPTSSSPLPSSAAASTPSSSNRSTSTAFVTSTQPSLTTGTNSLSGSNASGASRSAHTGALLLSAGAATLFAIVVGGSLL